MGSTPYIEPEDWKEFVQMCESEEAVIESERYKLLREQYKHEHYMGPTGYEGTQAQWDEEDRKLASLGIANPYEEFREGRTRSWLRARSKLVMTAPMKKSSCRMVGLRLDRRHLGHQQNGQRT